MGLVGLSPGLPLLQGTRYSRLWPEQRCVPGAGCLGEEAQGHGVSSQPQGRGLTERRCLQQPCHPALACGERCGATWQAGSWCCCHASPFPAHSTLIPALRACCAGPPQELQCSSPAPRGSPPGHVQKDEGYSWVGHAPVRWGATPIVGAVSSLSHRLDLPKAAACPSAQRRALSLPILQNSSPSPQKPGSRLFPRMAPAATSVAIWRCRCPLLPGLCNPTPAWLRGLPGYSSAPGPATWGKDLTLEK